MSKIFHSVQHILFKIPAIYGTSHLISNQPDLTLQRIAALLEQGNLKASHTECLDS